MAVDGVEHRQVDDATTKEQQLETEVADLRAQLKLVKADLENARNHVAQFQEISQASEAALVSLSSTHEEYKVEEVEDADPLEEYGVSKDAVMGMIGTEIAKMHLADIVHGDLTTSNMMLRHPMAAAPQSPSTQLVLIDFGLAYTSALVEDKAVDLYVLERAFASTHPDSQPLFDSVLKAYERKMGKQWAAVGRRLEDVRMRGHDSLVLHLRSPDPDPFENTST